MMRLANVIKTFCLLDERMKAQSHRLNTKLLLIISLMLCSTIRQLQNSITACKKSVLLNNYYCKPAMMNSCSGQPIRLSSNPCHDRLYTSTTAQIH
jgi:hypothetical protein